jgi:putative chitinase
MKLSTAQLDQITGHTKYAKRKTSLADVLASFPEFVGQPHQMAQFLAQIMHESMGMRHTKEIWGPSAAQKRYEGRKDLGNVRAGDGKRFSGRDYIQTTGRANYRSFTAWLRGRAANSPDFEAKPELLETPEYLGMSAIWYWSQRVPARYVDEGNIEMVTRRVNGGLNGYADRLRYYDRAALVLLGYGPLDVEKFQAEAKIEIDGISGPVTRAVMHQMLKSLKAEVVSTPAKPKTHWLLQLLFGEKS